jgi:neopullulanase
VEHGADERNNMILIRLTLTLLLAGASLRADAPQLNSVEPPSWWPGHSLNPVRLLLRGDNLAGTRLTVDHAGCRPGLTRVNPAGTSLLADLHIDRNALPGPVTLRVTAPDGSNAEVTFDLLESLPRQGRFQGINQDDIIYLIMIDRFANGDLSNDQPPSAPGLLDRSKGRFYHGGDLQGVLDRLPYLRELGVTALWLTPWYSNANRLNEKQRFTADNKPDPAGDPSTDYHGYHAVDFYAVEEHFGTLATLRALVDGARAAGIKIIQDQIANHTGPYHPWVTDPPTPTWFNGTQGQHLDNPSQLWTLADPHSPPALQRPTLEGWFANVLPDLNQNDEDCARYLIQNSLWWVGLTGLDAIRQDTLPYVPRSYWNAWARALKREHPQLNVIGEVLDSDSARVSFFQGGRVRFDGIDSGIDLLFDFPLYYAVRRAFASGESLRQLPHQLARDHLYPNPNGLVTFLGLHDVSRFMSDKGATVGGLRLAFTFLLTTRGVPLIYYGDEIAMRGGDDPDNRRDFPGGWIEDPRNAFTAAGRTAEQQGVFEHVARLTRLRRESDALRRGRLVHLAVEDRAYVYGRISPRQRMIVALNNTREPRLMVVNLAPLGPTARTRLEPRLGVADPHQIQGQEVTLSLPAMAGIVWEVVDHQTERPAGPAARPADGVLEPPSPEESGP